ncbi:G protein-coupled glucose receptor regulating Gpa2-domain-containing protein, partial [Limtongia smithiae]|uniref:G protein-coupled glucose receptor regulating Gpa2-domain-containing protein n=1 Tax=Limtongia smithiae TaxID=1125753 RepID=UPI0034CFE136
MNSTFVFSAHDRHGIRIISFTASWLSIISCLIAFYWLWRMRGKVFRHLLIFWLLFFDCWRAVILMWYPIRLWYTGEDSIGPHSCQADGFFAALSIEASDFAVLLIAIHTALFIMYPQMTSPGLSAYRYGGLYRYRYYVYAVWAGFSILFASLPFVNSVRYDEATEKQKLYNLGYVQISTMCYLPVRPIWYRLVLAWVPRYIVFMSICVIYVGIYIYVRKVLSKVDRAMTTVRRGRHDAAPGINDTDVLPIGDVVPHSFDGTIQDRQQRVMIERQVKYLFLYPIFYVVSWALPFVETCMLFTSDFLNHPVVWLGYISAFSYAISGLMNTLIFAIRERPWRQCR